MFINTARTYALKTLTFTKTEKIFFNLFSTFNKKTPAATGVFNHYIKGFSRQ